jgi:hypothetical protein
VESGEFFVWLYPINCLQISVLILHHRSVLFKWSFLSKKLFYVIMHNTYFIHFFCWPLCGRVFLFMSVFLRLCLGFKRCRWMWHISCVVVLAKPLLLPAPQHYSQKSLDRKWTVKMMVPSCFWLSPIKCLSDASASLMCYNSRWSSIFIIFLYLNNYDLIIHY